MSQVAGNATPPPTDFAELVRAELSRPGCEDDSLDNLHGKSWLVVPPRQLFGIALSGGGIRSATFNLGLLQGLQERGFLRGFDYLATVSGGGYTGAFWTQWRRLHPERPFPESAPNNEAEPHEIRHLRRFSNFLSPSLGIFSFDTGRVIIALINAVIPSLVGAITFLAVVLLGTVVLGFVVLVLPGVLAHRLLPPMEFRSLDMGMVIGGFACMALFAIAHFAAMCKIWRESVERRRVTWTGIVFVLLVSIAWGLSAKLWAGVQRRRDSSNGNMALCTGTGCRAHPAPDCLRPTSHYQGELRFSAAVVDGGRRPGELLVRIRRCIVGWRHPVVVGGLQCLPLAADPSGSGHFGISQQHTSGCRGRLAQPVRWND